MNSGFLGYCRCKLQSFAWAIAISGWMLISASVTYGLYAARIIYHDDIVDVRRTSSTTQHFKTRDGGEVVAWMSDSEAAEAKRRGYFWDFPDCFCLGLCLVAFGVPVIAATAAVLGELQPDCTSMTMANLFRIRMAASAVKFVGYDGDAVDEVAERESGVEERCLRMVSIPPSRSTSGTIARILRTLNTVGL